MTESEVWRTIVKHLREQDVEIYCGCPPGATCYEFRNCNLVSDRVDAPDLIFRAADHVFLCEMKPTWRAIKSELSGESDLQKLSRLVTLARSGYFDEQLAKNFGVPIDGCTRFHPCVGYEGKVPPAVDEFLHLVVFGPGDVRAFNGGLVASSP